MDPLKLLSRSTRRKSTPKSARDAPSAGQDPRPQLFPESTSTISNESRKRKRGQDAGTGAEDVDNHVDFFGRQGTVRDGVKEEGREGERKTRDGAHRSGVGDDDDGSPRTEMAPEACRRLLKEHKLKVTWLNPPRPNKERRKGKSSAEGQKKTKDTLVPQPLLSFTELRSRYKVGERLVRSIIEQGYDTPTEVQIAALPLLLDTNARYLPSDSDDRAKTPMPDSDVDLLSVAPTGSGKTLAFLIPLLDRLRRERREHESTERHTSAVILAPTKELAGQIVNEGRKLAKNTGVRVTQMRKGMKFGHQQASAHDNGHALDEENEQDHTSTTVVKADVIVSTPGILQGAIIGSAGLDNLRQVRHLVLDEADVLLDPLFKEQTLSIWNGLTHPKLRISMWSATMGSNVEELARSTISARHRNLLQSDEKTAEAPLIRLIVGLKDSAAPNVEHKLLYAASEQGKLMGLRQLLHPTSSSHEAGPILRPPFLVFTQTIERAIALHSELRYDIPAEAGGISRIAVLHADLSATARDDVMTRFRKGTIWVLITTDLLSRGVDFRGVNGVVNYDIPGSSAAYIHRIGRTGRAGREGGVAVTLYSKEDMPYLKHIANVMAMAQRQRGEEATDMQKWLVDALPKLSKNEKQALKKHGVKSRTAKRQGDDSKVARRTKISTKAGFVRRAENRKKGAKAASQRMLHAGSDSDAGNESDFAGFD